MPKNAVSVTLDADNVLWLKGRTHATGGRSLSDTLDRLITDARTGGRHLEGGARSVVGTIDIDRSDVELAGADEAIRQQFVASIERPWVARERPPARGRRAPDARKGRGRRG